MKLRNEDDEVVHLTQGEMVLHLAEIRNKIKGLNVKAVNHLTGLIMGMVDFEDVTADDLQVIFQPQTCYKQQCRRVHKVEAEKRAKE